jgi:hypothetical protein
MKTYTPIRGMIPCLNDTGDFVEKSDFDALCALAQRMAEIIRADAAQTERLASVFDEEMPEYVVTAKNIIAEWDAFASPND